MMTMIVMIMMMIIMLVVVIMMNVLSCSFKLLPDIDILEEFAHLYTDDSYNLDLVPVTTSGSR